MNVENAFGIIDYCMFAGVLAISSGIGFYFSYIGNKSPEEFLMGNRTLKTLPVAMSLLTSYTSAIGLLGYSGEVYGNGMQIGSIILGGPSALIFASYFVLPVLYPLKLTSINEYIELRFKSKNLRVAVFLPIFLKAVVTSAVALYATSLALVPIMKFDNLTNILLLGIICTLYSSFGGVKAIVWTDVFQLIIMIVGLTTIVTIGIIQNGGFIETLHTASKGGRMEFFDMRLNPFLRFSFINSFIYSFSSNLGKYVSDQICCQRLYAVKNIDNAKKVLQYNIYGKVIIFLLIFCGGLMAYATYAGCDPMALGLIKKKDQILPFFVMDKLSLIPGLPGIFVATVLGGTLSSISSYINSCAALIWRDVLLKFDFFQRSSSSFATLTNKLISLLVGATLTGLAIIASRTNGLVAVMVTLNGILVGPPLGVFLIGYFFPKCNLKGTWIGYIVSSALLLWITIGHFIYKNSAELLPFSADQCIESNFTSMNITGVREYISFPNNTIENININTSFIVSLYKISSSLYVVIGSLICVLLAVSVSFLTGNEKIEKISPKLISHCVRKFYWTKEELANFQDNKTKDDNYE